MLRRLLGVLALSLPFLITGIAAGGGTAYAADCQHTFHARPTVTGYQDDPCSTRTANGSEASFSIRVRWFWSMSGGAHIENVQGVLTICRVDTAFVQWVRSDAVSVNRTADGVAINHSLVMDDPTSGCSTLLTPATTVTGCGAVGTPGAGVTVFAQGRGTWLDINDGVHRIPQDGGTLPSSNTYYKMC